MYASLLGFNLHQLKAAKTDELPHSGPRSMQNVLYNELNTFLTLLIRS